MKLFTKLFFSTMLILTVILSVAEYVTVAGSMENEYESQQEEAFRQHQLILYGIRAGILSAAQGSEASGDFTVAVATETASDMRVSVMLADESGKVLYSNLGDVSWSENKTFSKETIVYETVRSGDSTYLLTGSLFTQNGQTMQLTVCRDMSEVFRHAQALRRKSQVLFLIEIGVGAVLILVLTYVLTEPLQDLEKATRAFAAGDYSQRPKPKYKDEIGSLTVAFNQMADQVEDNIEALERAAKTQKDFVANFSHELKTPMTSIIGYADTLYQKDLPPEEVKETAGIILSEGMRLEALSFKLLDLIALDNQALIREETEMKDFLTDVFQTAQPLAEKRGVKLEIDAERAYCRIEMDLMKTMVLNLLDNAFKSGTDIVRLTGKVSEQAEERYVIRVEDHGRGIPEEQLSRITEAFYMVDKARSRKEHGAGLGLALCQKIAELHGTSLQYESKEGKGTTVSFALAKEADE